MLGLQRMTITFITCQRSDEDVCIENCYNRIRGNVYSDYHAVFKENDMEER